MSNIIFQERPNEFWSWFLDNESYLVEVESDTDPILDTLLKKLHLVDDRLFFEIATNADPKEFIITAAGNVELFPFVDILVSIAPPINGWKIISLKPAKGFDFQSVYEGVMYEPQKMWFLPLDGPGNPPSLGLRIGIPSADTPVAKKKMLAAVTTILETGVGERTYASEIKHLEVATLPDSPDEAGYIELPDLAKYIAWRKRRLAAQIKPPSES